jgi:hypothetical protein
VTAQGKRWKATIWYDSKRHNLGCFATKQEAALAYDTAAREHGGGKMKLNYVSIEAAEEAAAHAQAEHSCQPSGPKKACQTSSGFHGVRAQGKRWSVNICYGGKRHYIGTFDTPQKAALAYDRAAREDGGGKATLNYESMEAAEDAAAQAEAEYTKSPQPSGSHMGSRGAALASYRNRIHPLHGGEPPSFPANHRSAGAWLVWEMGERKLTKCNSDNSRPELSKLVNAEHKALFPEHKNISQLKYPRGNTLQASNNHFWRAYCHWYSDEAIPRRVRK